MTVAELLQQIVDIKGVTSAAVVSSEGFIVDGRANGTVDLGFVGGLIASSLATSRVLASLMGDEPIQQAMIEYESAPVLLMPLDESTHEDGFLTVVTLDSPETLGRARFQLRRLLPDIRRALDAKGAP